MEDGGEEDGCRPCADEAGENEAGDLHAPVVEGAGVHEEVGDLD